MKTSPRRPLILKRRRLPPAVQHAPAETARQEPPPPGAQASTEVAEPGSCKFPAGIKIINHPTMPNTQVVGIPNNADVQSIIAALTAKGKESGSSGPNKFILISCGRAPTHPPAPQPRAQAQGDSRRTDAVPEAADPKPAGRNQSPRAAPRLGAGSCAGGEAAGCALDNSLTSAQWLGKMGSDGLGLQGIKQEAEDKENSQPEQNRIKVEGPSGTPASWRESVSERPPYSYMAMIQFAINSTEQKRMTLKDIYTWIEDHFPYFKHIAKPGWKNSIRHNLSLHDMFVRETSDNGKVSFWTIHPSANRYLTLDQVFKPLDPGSPQSPQHLESQQKRPNPELRQNVTVKAELPLGARRKMKPLLPRVSSYLVPIQFPVSQPLLLPPPTAALGGPEPARPGKRVRIAPKGPLGDEGAAPLPAGPPTTTEEPPPGRGESPPLEEWPSPGPSPRRDAPRSPAPRRGPPRSPAARRGADLLLSRRQRRERSRSRRKQHLLPPRGAPEPELLLPGPPGPPEPGPGPGGPFRTPVKDAPPPPAASTPSPPGAWGLAPPARGEPLDCSPVRAAPPGAFGPLGPPGLGAAPLDGLPLFDSPRELLHAEPFDLPSDPFGAPELELPKPGSPDAPAPAANRSLTEGLVLDTMNDSLSKVLLDVSFPGLDEDALGPDAGSWAHFIPELR